MKMMMKKMGVQNGFIFGLLFCFFFVCVSVPSVFAADDATAKECSDDFQKVMNCLDYAKGKATTPSNECCSAVKGIKDSDPKCLCFIIQQASSGSETLKSMGVQEAKLLQLPSACQLQNASISNCPKLLGLSPSSPDAAIFSNASSSATPATPATKQTAAPEKADGSAGTKHRPYLVGPTMVIALAIFVYAFPSGCSSIFNTWG